MWKALMVLSRTVAATADLTRMPPVAFVIALVLSDAERHGFEILQAVQERARGSAILGPGTLYRTLQEMQRMGIVERGDRRPVAELHGEDRQYYRLTPLGRRVAAGEMAVGTQHLDTRNGAGAPTP
jgi:DNA-binding PadR family transcriptional regulator